MSSDRCWTDADRDQLAQLIAVPTAGLSARVQDADHQMAAAILDHLTAAGWHPPIRHGDPHIYELSEREAAAAYGRAVGQGADYRVGAALADLEHVAHLAMRTHTDECWRWHVDCLAARLRRTLTGEDTP